MNSPRPGSLWFGQPRGLTILFLTQMWEQFSYYGMRALLVYYMTRQLMLSQPSSSHIYGLYTAFAYFTPLLGGIIADRWLGRSRAVILGGSIMAAGHFMMAFEPLFYLALATIAAGNGLFLPSLPSQIGDLYERDDPKRGWAYNVYYVGINLGGFLAPLICGTLGELYGWHWGFGAAGVGMLLGLIIYILGRPYLPPERRTDVPVPTVAKPAQIVYLLVAIGLAITVFRGAYEQVGNTVALWAETGVDRAVGGHVIPATWFQSLNPLLVILVTPALLRYWRSKLDRGEISRPLRRMALGASIVAFSYLLLAFAAAQQDQASWLWLAAFFAILTLGELFILPTGLGIFARLAPASLGATTVASWYLAIFTGSLFAGWVGGFWSALPRWGYFVLLAGLACMASLILMLIDRSWRQLLDEKHNNPD